MSDNPLGKPTSYVSTYTPELLFPIARKTKREELQLSSVNFVGQDIWNAYELSWLNARGCPQVAIGEFRFDAASDYIVESKSLKLYLNSFNQSVFDSIEKVSELIAQDLAEACGALVSVKLYPPHEFAQMAVSQMDGELLDNLETSFIDYSYNPETLAHSVSSTDLVEEVLVSHLLKSNCLITSQPDWASIQIRYYGKRIDREKLIKYLVSFRSHNEFHEQCVERIFSDLNHYCKPEKLTVYARYTRRGGLDINPWRSNFESTIDNIRLARQ